MMSRIKCLILATVEHLGMFQLPLSASRPWIGEAFYMVSTPIREMTKNSPIPPPTCPPELVFAFYQIELSEDSRISKAIWILQYLGNIDAGYVLSWNGALRPNRVRNGRIVATQENNNYVITDDANFDASKSNALFGSSDTNQPKSLRGYLLIRYQ